MNRFAFALASASTLTLAAPTFAGNLDPAPMEAPVAVAVVPVQTAGTDWTGFYGGLSAGYGWGDEVADDADDATYGLFGGYNYDLGNWVLGGELEYAKTDLDNGTAEIDDMTRLKFRAGYDLGKVVVYGIVGANYANATIGGTDYSDTGVSYGLGADYALSDAVVAGFEVLQNDFNEFDDSGSDLSATTVGAKIAYRF
ncbi:MULTISPECIES: outer membrane protein [Pacificibacter]|uniref:outer membrane protein n=1 Tax=Pacificibacter TaxID=1042323 RepID=UPI001C088AFC|nr:MULTISPECIES: outer membrane beta-barrel protein [Pacificibacter]MBU2936939.1 outer membrane beta-barrel protein [Pacificibacter marinus]MDO6614933.1 outer membrane beta-barrel protein [Pacificibacter sp. 1_MG-2023]